jgi:SAM-dependent methyltransferase
MLTDYDPIADQYKRSKLQPWRAHIEAYTLFALVGDPAGQSVVDMACGEGFFTRQLKQRGASRVIGVDRSPGMIELARAQEGERPLGIAYIVDDVQEMEAISSKDGVLNIFVERYDDDSVRRLHIGKPASAFNALKKPPGKLDGHALTRFVLDALAAADHHRDDHTLLVVWGHAYDFAFGRKRERDGTVDALDFAELRDRLDEIQKGMYEFFKRDGAGYREVPKLGIIGFDSCELSTVEMACQLQPYAQYLLGSEIGIPIPGWPYDRILDRIRAPKGDRPMGPAEFGTYIVRRFCESYQASQDAVSLTLLDLTRTDELAEHAAWLAQRLAIAIGDPDSLNRITELFFLSQTEEGRPYVDVADLCLNLIRESDDAAIIAAATALGDFLVSPRRAVVGLSESGGGRPLVVEHGRNAGKLARLNGISLYAPHVAPDDDLDEAERLYSNFTFAQQTHWRALVHALARG